MADNLPNYPPVRRLYYNFQSSTGAHVIDDDCNEIAEVFDVVIGTDEAARLSKLFVASPQMKTELEIIEKTLRAETIGPNEIGVIKLATQRALQAVGATEGFEHG